MRKLWLAVLILSVSLFCGCTRDAHLYPVQGPLSQQTPLPVLIVKTTGAFNPHGISIYLRNGDVCAGTWTMSAKSHRTASTTNVPTLEGMAAIWDTVYGPGFYSAHVVGTHFYAQAQAAGPQGTTFLVEMFQPENALDGHNPATIKGVARDNHDNIYKLLF